MDQDTSGRGSRVLVVGATGGHGGTGFTLLEELRQRGWSVRALARTDDERTSRLRDRGVEVVVGDLLSRASMLSALEDCTHAYFTYPIRTGIVEAAATFASAARERRLARVVVNSMAAAHPSSPSALGRAQWLADELFQWSGVPCTVLRVGALYMENLTLLHANEVRDTDGFASSFGDAPVPWIAAADVGRLAAAALVHPELFEKSVVNPPGAELLRHSEIAAMLTEALGRTISFSPASAEAWASTLRARAVESPGGLINEGMALHISAIGASFGGGRPPLRAPGAAELAKLTGTAPTSMREFIDDNRAAFDRGPR